MKIEIIERKYKASKKFTELVEDKLSRLDKYFGKGSIARVVASKQGKREKLEITIMNKGIIYRSEVESDNMYANIDMALPKIERQIVRRNEKLNDKKAKTPVLPFEFIEKKPAPLAEIFKKKSFDLDPMVADEAREALERLDHDFYIFLNAETGKVNVLYRRKDDKLGLIEVNF